MQSVVLSGVYSGIPYILLALLIPVGGLVADLMRKRISTTIVRKILTIFCKQLPRPQALSQLFNVFNAKIFLFLSLSLSLPLPSAFTVSGSFLLLCSYYGKTSLSAVLFLTVAVGARGIALSGFGCNHLDIAPRYGGVLMGLTNGAATIPGFIGPYIAKSITLEVNRFFVFSFLLIYTYMYSLLFKVHKLTA